MWTMYIDTRPTSRVLKLFSNLSETFSQHVRMFVCVCVCEWVCVCVCECECVYLCVCVCMYVSVCVYVGLFVLVCFDLLLSNTNML